MDKNNKKTSSCNHRLDADVIQNEISIKEMCETIAKADILKKKDGTKPTPHEIFEYSPTGELFWIFVWYTQAKAVLAG